jgi:hypothetical protein
MCIYCRQTEADGLVLEDEHIIPDGIGGDLILPKASCRHCAEKVNGWEQRVQTRNLGATRAGAGLKSRKRRGRKEKADRLYRMVWGLLEPDGTGGGAPIEDPSDFPQIVISEVTKGRPELLGGKIPGNAIHPHLAYSRDRGGTPLSVAVETKGGDFLRLIAKIAHGFAVASVGIDSFSPFLTSIILEEGYEAPDLWKFIGGLRGPQINDELHRVRLESEVVGLRSASGLATKLTVVLVAKIQLFVSYQAPLYEVAVGVDRRFQ